MAKSRRRSKPLQWRLECAAHTLVELFASVLPGAWVFRMGEWLGGLAWHLFPKRRRIVIRNLRIAFAGELGNEEIQRMARESFRRTGGNLISSAHTAKLTPEQLRESLTVENTELLEQARAEGRGVVLLLAHMGNWEVLSRLIHLFPAGSRVGAMYRPLNNPLLDRRVLERREKDGARMFSKRDPFHQITGFLREGGIVGVLADQRVGRQGDLVQFFGRLTKASPLPSLLARRSKSTVLSLSLVTKSPGKWQAVLRRVSDPGTTVGCMAALEEAMKCSLPDVFWMQDRWRIKPRPKFPPEEWVGPPGTNTDPKPLRSLIWLADANETAELPPAWRHRSISYEVALRPGQKLPAWLPPDTRTHEAPTAGDMVHWLEKIDQAVALPLDFIVTFRKNDPLARACHHLELAVARLS